MSGQAVNQHKIAILISGRGSNMMALVEQARGYEVALVASDKPDAPGLAWARDRGLATWALSPKGIGKAAYEAQLDAALRAAGVTVIALAGYMRLVSDDFVTRWRDRIVNIHPSLLPLYKGLDTHRRAIEAGDAEGGCSVHIVTEELDGGRLLGQTRVPILPGDDANALAARVLIAEHALYPRILAEFVMSPADHIHAFATKLPEAEAQRDGAVTRLLVDGREFARVDGDRLVLPAEVEGDAIDLTDAFDRPLVEDRIARAWEVTAPARLLEVGGR